MRDLRFFAPRRPLEPGEDGRVWAYYYIEDISSPTQIIYAAGGVGSTLIVDGVSVPRNGTTYQFTSTGMHLIRYNMACTAKNFLSISTVKEIYIPNSVTSLPYQFIDNAHNLEKLVAPSVTTLSASGIGIRNTSIHEVILPSVTNFVEALGSAQTYLELESVVQIGPDAANRPIVFAGAGNMQTVILGPNCQTIGSRLFQSVNWIPTIVIKATTPPTVMIGAMSNMGSDVKFYVPYSSDHSILDAYKIADGFSSYASQIYELNPDGTVPEEKTLVVNPSSYEGSTTYNASNGYTDETSNTYAYTTVPKVDGGEGYCYWKFDTSVIPYYAQKISIQCVVSAYSTRATADIDIREIQMFSGTTPKDTAQTMSGSRDTFAFITKTWSASELSDVRVRVYAHRITGSAGCDLRFYGATLTINYLA